MELFISVCGCYMIVISNQNGGKENVMPYEIFLHDPDSLEADLKELLFQLVALH